MESLRVESQWIEGGRIQCLSADMIWINDRIHSPAEKREASSQLWERHLKNCWS